MKNLTRAYDCILSSVRLGVSFRVDRVGSCPTLEYIYNALPYSRYVSLGGAVVLRRPCCVSVKR